MNSACSNHTPCPCARRLHFPASASSNFALSAFSLSFSACLRPSRSFSPPTSLPSSLSPPAPPPSPPVKPSPSQNLSTSCSSPPPLTLPTHQFSSAPPVSFPPRIPHWSFTLAVSFRSHLHVCEVHCAASRYRCQAIHLAPGAIIQLLWGGAVGGRRGQEEFRWRWSWQLPSCV